MFFMLFCVFYVKIVTFKHFHDIIAFTDKFSTPEGGNTNMKENTNVAAKRHTQQAVELLKKTLSKYGVDNGCVQIIKDAIYIAPQMTERLSEELLGEIRDIFYWTHCVVVSDIDGLVRFDADNNTVLINLENYEEIAGVHEQLVSYGTVIKKLEHKHKEFSYEYDLNGHPPLDYEKLEDIRDIVNPARTNPRSAIVFAYRGIYSIKLQL